jgi:uncharacterized MnhB-related membrane protein
MAQCSLVNPKIPQESEKPTRPQGSKNLTTCQQVVTMLLFYQVATRLSLTTCVSTLLVPSCCDKSGTSCYHLVTRLMTVTDLLQVVPTRLIQAVCNKLLQACCHQFVNNLLRADDIRLLEQLVASLLASSTLLVAFMWSRLPGIQ